MAEKKQESFTVTDRRLFTSEGELRKEVSEETETSAKSSEKQVQPSATPLKPVAEHAPGQSPSPVASASDVPPLPSAAEQQQQADAYHKSSRELDSRVELGGHSAKDLEMTFERFVASLYMTAMLQLGLLHEEGGQPRIDLIGARQTIDTLTLLAEKTKGNLTAAEDNFLRNSLYELRMAYVEVTNALARPPQAPGSATGTEGR